MFWNQTDETSRRHLYEIVHDDFTKHEGYHFISSPVDPRQMKEAKTAYAGKWGSDLFAESWPLFCILDVDGKTLVVKNTREFVRQNKVDDSLVQKFLSDNALQTSGQSAGQ